MDPQNSNGLAHIARESNVHCIVCRRDFHLESETSEAFVAICICRECKTVVFDDQGTNATTRDIHRRRRRRGRVRQGSVESVEDLFLQEFSQLINLVRQNPGAQVDGGSILGTPSNGTSSRNRSMRWRRALSDTESDGHDHMDSLYGESDSNFSFSGYGGESDASFDGRSLLDQEMFVQFDDESHLNTDTDIDPMHTGLDPWNSDQDEDDVEWEEVDVEEEMSGQVNQGGQIQDVFDTPLVNRARVDWGTQEDRRLWYPNIDDVEWEEVDVEEEMSGQVNQGGQIQDVFDTPLVNRERVGWGTREGRRLWYPNILSDDLEESGVAPYIGRSGDDYLDGRGFEELLEHLAETDDSRRGAPPTAVSFVDNLPRVVVSKDHEKNGGLTCAICKDPLLIGAEASKLPCFHFYHPPCILPWLSTRNSCPVCRFELPTDDHDYEEGKRNSGRRMELGEIRGPEPADESSSSTSSDLDVDETNDQGRLEQHSDAGAVDPERHGSHREGGGAGWLLLAAAPIVGILGVAFVLWLGKPVVGGRRRPCMGGWESQQPQRPSSINPPPSVGGGGSSSSSNRRNRRWWPFF